MKGEATERERLEEVLRRVQEEAQQLSAALSECWEELTLLYDLAEKLRGVLEIEKGARLALERAAEILPVEGAAFLSRTEGGRWFVRFSLCPPERDEWLRSAWGHSVADEAIKRKRGFIVNDLWGHPEWGEAARAFRVQNLVAVPLNPEGHAKGVLTAWNNFNGEFTSPDLKLLSTIALQAGGVIESAYLFQRLQETFQGIVSALAMTVDAKSKWTAGHSHRVALYALWLGEKVGLDEVYLEKVRLSGLLHDIGKIGIPDAILDKPGRLTPDEFEVVKRHPQIGYEILQGIRQFHGDILDGVLYHHERVDGKGYPKGLRDKEIPFMGRLLAVADGFDAITSERPYRPGMPKEQALQVLREGAGTQWDKELALAFVDLMRARPLLRSEEAREALRR